ncbi:ninjurin-1 [Diachasma alloeum]|uniref:ninjurin-1 n=1 Tax=Diachasma alloeum TaxID=454923 RepID=UPI0007384EF5|nr:ninjurin-1 [Diachasma alloeum]
MENDLDSRGSTLEHECVIDDMWFIRLLMSREGAGDAYDDASVVAYVDDVELTERPVTNSLGMRSPNSGNARSLALLETDNAFNPPPTYGPEVDDLEPAGKRGLGDDDRGIDDGLLPGRPFTPRPSNGVPPQSPFDVNVYQQKKTLAQGMMDLALISANANQLRYVLGSKSHPFYLASLVMICMSLALQIAVGIGLIWNSRYDVKEDDQVIRANRANNWTVIGVFLVTILNVFISSFGVIDPPDVITIPLKNASDGDGGIEPLNRIGYLNGSIS